MKQGSRIARWISVIAKTSIMLDARVRLCSRYLLSHVRIIAYDPPCTEPAISPVKAPITPVRT